MNKFLQLFFCLLFTFGLAQKNFLTVPKVIESDLLKQKSEIDPDAPAEVLYRSMKHFINTDAHIESTYILRIKIYDKERANDYLSPEFMVYETDRGDRERVSSFSAMTYNLDNGKIITNKVDNDSKFRSKEDKNYIINKFTFPNVKNGSIVEYKYTIYAPSTFLWSIDRYIVDMLIPQIYVDYQLEVPKFLAYNINYKGTLSPGYREVGSKYRSDYEVYRFGYENVKPYKEEKYVANNDNYKTVIKAELNSTHINNVFTSYAISWNDISKRLNDFEDFGGELKKMNLVKSLLPSDIKTTSNNLDKANKIFQFVQNNYSWNKEISLSTDKGIRNLISTKIGNSAEINLLLTMLMKDAGLNALPVGIPTIKLGKISNYSPSISQLNYVFTAFQDTDGSIYYYDATSKTAKVYELPRRALNGTGVLFDGKEGKLISVFYPKLSQTILTVDADFNLDGTFSGSFKDVDTNLYGNFVKEQYDEGAESFHKIYKDEYPFTITDLKSESLEDGNFQTSMNFSADSFVDQIGNKFVFNPLLFLFTKNHDFDQTDERKAPIEFSSANEKIKKVTIKIPDGYEFQNIPSSKKFRTDDNMIVYSYNTKLEGNNLVVETSIKIEHYEFEKEYYKAFKQIFDNITKLEGQVVTVVKK